ncbi:alpha-amylase family glycosyl hydrolase [Geminocystis sp. GBBB08]|uniref:alpha-amylase family glycosyl hydrolase n=1 Tax=Geminocystis sp. GBBB08 TaxID=2604140 RepID=UPI0027E303F2|nr:alpha-amylase family glycosyl hydrolase [Geminocystis sp. GBBB08]MBL1210586.1 cyclomaltodextrin glucanotransferase [Geminocystis sp. GBBB08]
MTLTSYTGITNAAAGFYTSHQTETKDSNWEFLFTRAIEFRQETIYFIIVDRFLDGDDSNNQVVNPNLYDSYRHYWGNNLGEDIKGIMEKEDNLKGLGITAIWISPLFEQVESLQFDNAPMHGYWTKDFKRINPRFLPEGEENSLFKCTALNRLVNQAHHLGIKIILDIVCNHSSPDVSGEKGKLYDDGVLIADYYHDTNNWYYHNPEITDWENEYQLLYYEMAGLATFNESNINYRNYIKSAIKQWLDIGIDALRIDTVKHMPLWFWQEFMGDLKTHRPDLFAFGEWGFSNPKDGKSPQFANDSGMSILDFGLSGAIRECLAKNASGGFQLVQDVFNLDYLYNTATELITFFDNHDMPRFGSLNPDGNALRLAVMLIMTCRGIPCIYYGTEQYLHNDTNGGEDPYNRPMMEKWDTDTPIYQDLAKLSKLRRINPAISLGSQVEKYINEDIYCFLRRYRDFRCLVCFNKSYYSQTIQLQNTELPDGEYYCMLTQTKIEVINGNVSNLTLPPQSVLIFNYIGEKVKGKTIMRVQINGIKTQLGESIIVIGDCPELGNWDINKGYTLEYINPNTWFGEIPFNETAGKAIAYKYALVKNNQEVIREEISVRRWILAHDGIAKWVDIWQR